MKIFGNRKTEQRPVPAPTVLLPVYMIVLFIAAAVMAGCGKKPSGDVRIELEALDERDPSESDALFPSFVTKDEDLQKELEKLNREIEKLRDNYEERRQKDKQFIVHSYVGPVQAVPQCTVYWYEEHSLLGDDYNMMTLAYNEKTGELMTCKEALKSLPIDSVTLSTNVGKLFMEMQPSLKVKETEMQGFETDENGTVTVVYMKLVAEKQEEDPETADEETEEEIHFCYYDLEKETLHPISELGYEIP